VSRATLAGTRTPAAFLTACALLAAGCGSDGDAGPARSSAAAATVAESAATAPTPPSARETTRVGGVEVGYVPPDPARFRADPFAPGVQHWLPLRVASDDRAERWGDWFLFSPTQVTDPETEAVGPAPADPVAWLREHPDVAVVDEREFSVDGRTASLLDVRHRAGTRRLFGTEGSPGPETGDGGHERFVLWQVEGTWLLAQASTFRGAAGLAEPDRPDDPFVKYLAELRFG
jgi:hypothetical protein